MKLRRVIVLGAASLVVCASARAEWLLFEGVFDTYFQCGGRSCDGVEEQPVTIPFSFGVELPRGQLSFDARRTSQTQLFAPTGLPTRLLADVSVTRDAFFGQATQSNSVGYGYSTRSGGGVLRWDFSYGQGWYASTLNPVPATPPIETLDWSTELRVALEGPAPNAPANGSFAQLLTFMQGYVDRAELIPVLAQVTFRSSRDGDETGGSFSTLDGGFRLKGIACKAPSGLSALFGALRGG